MIAAYAEGAAVISNEVIQSWIQEEKIIVDIIWVIDNSGSMFPYQSMLADNMEAFMNIFLSYAPDFKMMFITTDSASDMEWLTQVREIQLVMQQAL